MTGLISINPASDGEHDFGLANSSSATTGGQVLNADGTMESLACVKPVADLFNMEEIDRRCPIAE